jgi:hypothetical protein
MKSSTFDLGLIPIREKKFRSEVSPCKVTFREISVTGIVLVPYEHNLTTAENFPRDNVSPCVYQQNNIIWQIEMLFSRSG